MEPCGDFACANVMQAIIYQSGIEWRSSVRNEAVDSIAQIKSQARPGITVYRTGIVSTLEGKRGEIDETGNRVTAFNLEESLAAYRDW